MLRAYSRAGFRNNASRSATREVSTRIRLANTQTVVAICELSNGAFWSDSAEIVVTLAACLEDGI